MMSVMIIIIMIAVMMIVMLMMTMVTVMVVMTSGSVKPRTSQPPPPCPLVLSGTCEPACVGSRLCRTAALCRWRASPSLSLWARHRAVAPPLVHAHLAPQRCPQGSCSLSLKQALQLLCPFSRAESKFGVSPRHSLGSFQDRLGFRGAPPQALGSSSSHPCAISRQTPAAGRRYIAFQCNALLAPQPQLLSPSLLKLTCARTLLLLHLALPSTNPVVHRFPRGARLLLPDIGTNLPTPEAAFRKQLAECT